MVTNLMQIDYRLSGNKWIVEVWQDDTDTWVQFKEPYPENFYTEINDWCIKVLGYHARTAYHIFEFKKRSDLDWFLLTWK